MEAKTSFVVKFESGKGEIDYPVVMKHSSANVHICCHNLYIPGVSGARGQCLSLTCEASYFRDEAFERQVNVMALFQLKSTAKLHSFENLTLPLTVTPQKIRFQILDMEGKVKPVAGLGLFHIRGVVRDKQFHI